MSINLGDIEKKNQEKNDYNVVDGLKLKKKNIN